LPFAPSEEDGPLEEDEEKKIDKGRLAAGITAFVGFLLMAFSIVVLLMLKLHVIFFVVCFALGLFGFVLGLYILVRTKPPAPEKGEVYDEDVPHSSVDFDDWTSQRSVNTFKSERPDPEQYKPKKKYKAFPVLDKEEKKKEEEEKEDDS
jgi:hypothetical protein